MQTKNHAIRLLICLLLACISQLNSASEVQEIKYISYKPTLRELVSGEFKKSEAALTAN